MYAHYLQLANARTQQTGRLHIVVQRKHGMSVVATTMDMKTALQIAKEIEISDIRTDARAILKAFSNARDSDDFVVDLGCTEYRIISDDDIDAIHRREIEDLVNDCYDLAKVKKEMGNVGQYLTLDYDALARDARISDGYGHHFALYDGAELEVGNYHIFRVN